jgi:hypothetical protein
MDLVSPGALNERGTAALIFLLSVGFAQSRCDGVQASEMVNL